MNRAAPSAEAFTLIELLTVLAVISVLAALSLGAMGQVKKAAQNAQCVSGLRQLGVVTGLYLAEHNQKFFPYRAQTLQGTCWYFGLENGTTWVSGEQQRNLDVTQGPLYPYLQQVGGVEICPAFDYSSALWKPKFKGASWGYGYNYALGGGAMGALPLKSIAALDAPSSVIVFGDCAQVNTFQPPATASHPMLEEFYIIDQTFKTIHFRHADHANFLFADGHVDAMKLWPGTSDARLKDQAVGRISPVGSMQFLQ